MPSLYTKQLRRFSIFVVLLAAACFGQPAHPPNAGAQQDKPYVLLISIDGFRYDYAERDHASNLLAFGKSGVTAKALIPSFPTTTFPNHYSIVTGLYPAHHGIVDNSFWDPQRNAEFKSSDPASSTGSGWWGGTPLWVLAEQQGMRAASFFWVGSDAEIQGTRPTYFYKYDGRIPNEQRVSQVVEWLKLPKDQSGRTSSRCIFPMWITQATSLVRMRQKRTPLSSKWTLCSASFSAPLRALPIPLDIFVVSDHGMATVTGDVDVSKLANLNGVEVAPNSTDFKFYSTDPKRIDQLYAELKGKDPRMEVYRRSEIPERLHYSGNPRIGDLVAFAIAPVVLHLAPKPGQTEPRGMHGYDVSRMPEMRGIFYAAGPDLKAGLSIEEFQNIHIYPLIAHILGLNVPAGIDGKLSVLAPILSETKSTAASAK